MSEPDPEDRASVERSKQAARSPSGQDPAARPAPITDRMDAEELRRGHDRIRSDRRRPAFVVAGIVAMVLAGALTAQYLTGKHNRREGTVVVPSGATRVAPEETEPVAAAENRAAPGGWTRNVMAEPGIQITPVARPRPHMVRRTEPENTVLAKSPLSGSPEKLHASAGKASASVDARARQRTRIVESRSPRETIAKSGSESGASAIPDEVFEPPARPHAPDTASYTPMGKEQVVADIREGSRSRTDERAKREAEDDTFGYLARTDRRRAETKRTERPTGPMVERRICLESRLLAGDHCPHTAIVALPESELPTRRCRIH